MSPPPVANRATTATANKIADSKDKQPAAQGASHLKKASRPQQAAQTGKATIGLKLNAVQEPAANPQPQSAAKKRFYTKAKGKYQQKGSRDKSDADENIKALKDQKVIFMNERKEDKAVFINRLYKELYEAATSEAAQSIRQSSVNANVGDDGKELDNGKPANARIHTRKSLAGDYLIPQNGPADELTQLRRNTLLVELMGHIYDIFGCWIDFSKLHAKTFTPLKDASQADLWVGFHYFMSQYTSPGAYYHKYALRLYGEAHTGQKNKVQGLRKALKDTFKDSKLKGDLNALWIQKSNELKTFTDKLNAAEVVVKGAYDGTIALATATRNTEISLNRFSRLAVQLTAEETVDLAKKAKDTSFLVQSGNGEQQKFYLYPYGTDDWKTRAQELSTAREKIKAAMESLHEAFGIIYKQEFKSYLAKEDKEYNEAFAALEKELEAATQDTEKQ